MSATIEDLEQLAEPKTVGGKRKQTKKKGTSPGDDFAAKTSWKDIVKPHGWEETSPGKYQHPDATHEITATTDFCKGEDGGERLYCFSDRTPLPQGKPLTKFAVYAYLNHGGDFQAAAKALRKRGHGDQENYTPLAAFASRVIFDNKTQEAFGPLPDGTFARVDSGAFGRAIVHDYYTETGGTISGSGLKDFQRTLSAIAEHDRPHAPVYMRVAHRGDEIIIDIGDRFAVVTPKGWSVEDTTDVYFTRPAQAKPLPTPERGGSFDDLRMFVNIPDDCWRLVEAWLVASYFDVPCPLVSFQGEHGSGKSCTGAKIMELRDPNTSIKRSPPSSVQNTFVAAHNCDALLFDNISKIEQWLSDALCTIVTGGAYASRTLFTNADETSLEARRPVMITSRTNVITETDLISRSIGVDLPPLDEKTRKTEEELAADWEKKKGKIFGSLLDLISKALCKLPTVELEDASRMADFTKIGFAVGGKEFLDAYRSNCDDAMAPILSEPLVARIMNIMERQPEWRGSATALKKALGSSCPDISPSILARNELQKYSSVLRIQGITIKRGKAREIVITKSPS